jgi:hypothetical protein
MSRVLQPCGTVAAYMRHRRKGQKPCKKCQKAWMLYYQKRGK